jgi:hypothetical protein
MRDGAMSSATLLRFGFGREVRDFLDWYARFIDDDGRVPAIVIIGRNEVNPVHEYDSQGQFVYACLQYYRFTGDRAFLEAKWPTLLKVLRYLESLRNRDLAGPPPESPEQLRYYGILPRSVSHEGYYPEPGNHSYWDNFWGLRGWRDATVIAQILDRKDALPWIRREEQELREALRASIHATMEHCRIDFIPGCAELCDFDPSSTAIALTACDVAGYLPAAAWTNTFERYWGTVQQRMAPSWRGSFSPYEFRIAQAFVQMGWKERALNLMKFLMVHRRPAGWRQWPEAVYVPADTPGYIGDMPHVWAASGFLATLRAMFIQEDERSGSLIIGAGIPGAWLESGDLVAVRDAPTYWGTVTIEIQRKPAGLSVRLNGTARPPGGFRFQPPFGHPARTFALNGAAPKPVSEGEVRIAELPAHLLFLF